MKKWLWLLAVPWFVVLNDGTNRYEVTNTTITDGLHPIGHGFDYKVMGDDMAEALNEAHEHRTHPNEVKVIEETTTYKMLPMTDNCGPWNSYCK